MAIDPAGYIIWVPNKAQKGLNLVMVNVTDGNASVLQVFNITVTVPHVTPTSPDNGSSVDTLTPELHWEFPQTDIGPITYDIYLATDPSASILLRSTYDRTGLKLTTLIDNTTYYWKVVPKAAGLTGEASPIWSFHVKLEIVPEHIVRLDLDRNNAVVIMVTAPDAGDYLKAMFTVVPLMGWYEHSGYVGGALRLQLLMGWGSEMLKPTASASILVAMDNSTKVYPLVGSLLDPLSFFFPNASRIIFPPTNASSPNASQWA